jgi:hypothetical protein
MGLWITSEVEVIFLFFYNRYMEQHGNYKQWFVAIAFTAFGLMVGFYYGSSVGLQKGIHAGVAQGISEERQRQELRRREAEVKAAQAVNPFGQISANPFEKNPTNPFDSVKVNPFE